RGRPPNPRPLNPDGTEKPRRGRPPNPRPLNPDGTEKPRRGRPPNSKRKNSSAGSRQRDMEGDAFEAAGSVAGRRRLNSEDEGPIVPLTGTCHHLQESPDRTALLKAYEAIRAADYSELANEGFRTGRFGEESQASHRRCAECTVRDVAEHEDVMTCLTCQYTGCMSKRHMQSHFITTNHCFGVRRMGGQVFCMRCGDYVYDLSFDRIDWELQARMAKDERELQQLRGKLGHAELKRRRKILQRGGYTLVGPSGAVIPMKRWTDEGDEQSDEQCSWPLPEPLPPAHLQFVSLGLRGMYNLGSTCFMSSVMQSLLRTPKLSGFFLGGGHNKTKCAEVRSELRDLVSQLQAVAPAANLTPKGGAPIDGVGSYCIACEMCTFFEETFCKEAQDMTDEDTAPLTPYRLLNAIWSVTDSLAGYEQQDAHEFLISLLDNLHVHLMQYSINEKRLGELRRAQAQLVHGGAASNAVAVKPERVMYPTSHACAPGPVPHGQGQPRPLLLGTLDTPVSPKLHGEKISQQSALQMRWAAAAGAAAAAEVTQQAAGIHAANHGAVGGLGAPPHPNSLEPSIPPVLGFMPAPIPVPGNPQPPGAGTRQSGLVSELFTGLSRSELVCLECGHRSSTYERFLEVSLSLRDHPGSNPRMVPKAEAARKSDTVPTPESNGVPPSEDSAAGTSTCGSVASTESTSTPVKKKSKNKSPAKGAPRLETNLHSCLERFTTLETLGCGTRCDAPGCSHRETSRKSKQMSFCRLPPILVLHLKRFDGISDQKVNDLVDFPARGLDMGKYLSSWAMDTGEEVKFAPPHLPYNLFAVVNHTGSLSQGHYTAFVRAMEQWFKCDDTWVTHATEEEVITGEAYLLFYSAAALL
ncbi:unnamed protein product, partial [Chrysoparadoxa australica]